MTIDEILCFRDNFLRWFMRGGGALCAESEAWGMLEQSFGRIYVSHPADEEILGTLSEKAENPDLGFLIVLIGMPGSGKTLLLRELMGGLRHDHFSTECTPMIDKITNTFEIRDVTEILPFEERKAKGDYPTEKRVVWVTATLDDFVDTSTEAKNSLQALTRKLNHGMGKGESLIVFGNRGILGDIVNKDDPVIRPLSTIVAARNKLFEFVRIPKEYDVFWIKQFGIEESLFNLTNGVRGFKQYSKTLINLSENCLRKCPPDTKDYSKCRNCPASSFLRYICELKEMLDETSFVERVHDLLFFLWLKHCDLYLTPRSLNLFWGYSLYNLWKLVRERYHDNGKIVDRSLIFDAVYSSKLPSIRGPEEYSLLEAQVHKYRNEKFELEILGQCEISLLNEDHRRRERLKLFFSPENVRYKEMIDDGALEEFSHSERLQSIMRQVLQKLVLMRPILVQGEKLGEPVTQSWSPEKLLFGPITELVEKKSKTRQKARRLSVVMFDDELFQDITFHGFRIVPNKGRYFVMRERILELDAKVRGVPLKKAPCLNLDLEDYEVLRDFTSRIKEPDLSLHPSLRREVLAFIRNLNGMADYSVAPLLYAYLKKRGGRNDAVGLSLYSLKHRRRCDVKIERETMQVSVDGETYAIDMGE